MSTELMYNIEYHNNPILLETINNNNFNPNHGLRKKSFIDAAVEYNNFDVFKALINHPKFDFQKILSKFFLNRIILRNSLADIPENRKYLTEIYNLNINIEPSFIVNVKAPFFFEIFEKINKTNMQALIGLISPPKNNDPSIFEFVFQYLKNNFPNQFNKQIIDNNFLCYVYYADLLSLLIIIKNEGYDISMIDNKQAPLIIENANSKCLAYLANENITYDNDFLLDIEKRIDDLTYYRSKSVNRILLDLISNLENIRKIYPNFNNNESNILLTILKKNVFTFNHVTTKLIIDTDYFDIMSSIALCFSNFKITNPINNFISNLKISKKASNVNNVRDVILRLVYYGGNLNDESIIFLTTTNIFKKEEIDNIKKTADDLNKPKEIVIKKKKDVKK